MKACYLESERLYFKPLSRLHLSKNYVNWINDSDVNKYLESGGDYTIEKLESYLEQQEKKEILFWAIHLKKSNKHIGNIKIDPIYFDDNAGEYGIMMGEKNEWGKGFAYESSLKIIDYCFKNLGLIEIRLGVKIDNIAAVRLYEKLGFIKYNILKEQGVIRMKLHRNDK
jgi:RimJ/RimL family protein N-acetyltransferase